MLSDHRGDRPMSQKSTRLKHDVKITLLGGFLYGALKGLGGCSLEFFFHCVTHSLDTQIRPATMDSLV